MKIHIRWKFFFEIANKFDKVLAPDKLVYSNKRGNKLFRISPLILKVQSVVVSKMSKSKYYKYYYSCFNFLVGKKVI